jgi:hypothetical protein
MIKARRVANRCRDLLVLCVATLLAYDFLHLLVTSLLLSRIILLGN